MPDHPRLDHDPYLNDGNRWGVSLAHNAEFMLPCLDAAGATSVVEVGAFAGDLTRVLVDWAARAGARGGGAARAAPAPAPCRRPRGGRPAWARRQRSPGGRGRRARPPQRTPWAAGWSAEGKEWGRAWGARRGRSSGRPREPR